MASLTKSARESLVIIGAGAVGIAIGQIMGNLFGSPIPEINLWTTYWYILGFFFTATIVSYVKESLKLF
jgi:uncharacterized membrane protein